MAMNRRDFLKVSAGTSGSLMLSLSLPGCSGMPTGYTEETGQWKPDAWLEITNKDEIHFTLSRVEMGQGTYTGLTTLIAEELEVDPGRDHATVCTGGAGIPQPAVQTAADWR